ncbi:MAG: hypothetical protein PHT69_00100 [Bacteroidales bacterium]|nr:hypothetical protein [Bacteroidales bacterium]
MKRNLLFLCVIVFINTFLSCQKTDSVQAGLEGTWELVVFDHDGTEKWTFTPDNKILVILDMPTAGISGDTAAQGTYELSIVNYTHGRLLNKNIFKVPAITISGFENYKYAQSNIFYPACNTEWEVHRLDSKVLVLTTDTYNATAGGLVMKEFYRE